MDDDTINITVKLFANFRDGRFREAPLAYPAGTRIADIIAELGIAPKDIGMIFIRGKHAEAEQVLKAGDVLALFPLLGGG